MKLSLTSLGLRINGLKRRSENPKGIYPKFASLRAKVSDFDNAQIEAIRLALDLTFTIPVFDAALLFDFGASDRFWFLPIFPDL